MAKVNNFDVLKEMGERNLDIRGFPDCVGARKKKLGGVIEIGVNEGTLMDLLSEKPLVMMLIVADREQFNQVKAELEQK
jgi:hypothetical protein